MRLTSDVDNRAASIDNLLPRIGQTVVELVAIVILARIAITEGFGGFGPSVDFFANLQSSVLCSSPGCVGRHCMRIV